MTTPMTAQRSHSGRPATRPLPVAPRNQIPQRALQVRVVSAAHGLEELGGDDQLSDVPGGGVQDA
ncbi:hypothetical protein, partial [Streptomyces erythrochromogenes]|uniref:hypothetical protein n=1 Tax=Streptomyces erythrochromogenes TaxID=285574 RepID=UPI0036CA8BAE